VFRVDLLKEGEIVTVISSAEATRERSAVPFFDPAPSFSVLKSTLLPEFSDLIDSGAFINGPQVAAFEAAFAEYCGAHHCVGVASGLDALRLALIAGGLEPGDEVIVPANTFVATLEAVTQAGGVPVLVDISESDWNMDPAAVEAALTERTRFLMPVHLYGQMADMRALRAVAERAGVAIIEDACQAHGADRDGLRAGASGLAAGFSFYPAKNLGAMGDAGALVTTDPELAAVARALREHGQTRKYHHEREGFTARLDTIQAIVLLHKLPLLDGWTQERRAAAAAYSEGLEGVGDLVLPNIAEGSNPVWHLYVVRTEQPERMADFLAEREVRTGRHYPEPAHLSPAYAGLGYTEGSFPVTEHLAGGLLSLPIFPGISENQIASVVDAVTEYFA
jgi:dTDP-4-amino-4,6-dideoxygalactose transaminase